MRTPPVIGELIYGCQHGGTQCGLVTEVLDHVTRDGYDHWIVRESAGSNAHRVRREPNGLLYEVELTFCDG
jgi:hypothetical protein